MWTSVPQMPVRRTRIKTSLMPICGSGTSSSHSPGSRLLLTSAFMVDAIPHRGTRGAADELFFARQRLAQVRPLLHAAKPALGTPHVRQDLAPELLRGAELALSANAPQKL